MNCMVWWGQSDRERIRENCLFQRPDETLESLQSICFESSQKETPDAQSENKMKLKTADA